MNDTLTHLARLSAIEHDKARLSAIAGNRAPLSTTVHNGARSSSDPARRRCTAPGRESTGPRKVEKRPPDVEGRSPEFPDDVLQRSDDSNQSTAGQRHRRENHASSYCDAAAMQRLHDDSTFPDASSNAAAPPPRELPQIKDPRLLAQVERLDRLIRSGR